MHDLVIFLIVLSILFFVFSFFTLLNYFCFPINFKIKQICKNLENAEKIGDDLHCKLNNHNVLCKMSKHTEDCEVFVDGKNITEILNFREKMNINLACKNKIKSIKQIDINRNKQYILEFWNTI